MPVLSSASTLASFRDRRSYSSRVYFPGSAVSILLELRQQRRSECVEKLGRDVGFDNLQSPRRREETVLKVELSRYHRGLWVGDRGRALRSTTMSPSEVHEMTALSPNV